MEQSKRNTGTYTFYKPQNLRGRPNIYVRDFLNKIKTIEKKYPELFYEVLDVQGICTNINELNVLHKALTKKVRSYNKTNSTLIHCRFSENEISFFKNELERQIENKEWIKENSFNAFISKIINDIIEKEKQVVDIRVFKDVKPSDKKRYDSLIPLKVYESPNVENPSLKKKLGDSKPIKINKSNFDWIESTCKIILITRSNLIRKCLYSHRIIREINESTKLEMQNNNLISEEPIVSELQTKEIHTQDVETQNSDFNPFEKPVIKRNYKLNNENIKQKERVDLHNDINLLKDETILSIADYLNQKNECLYQKIESSIKTQFDFVESMFKFRIDEVKNIQSEIDSDRNFISSELIVFQKSIKEIEVNHKKLINEIKILSILNMILLILIIFFLHIINK